MTTKSAFSILGLLHQLCLEAERQGHTPTTLNLLKEDPQLLAGVLAVIEGKAKISFQEKYLVRVDRSVPPTFPFWAKGSNFPLLARSGPATFDIAKLRQLAHVHNHTGKMFPRYLQGAGLLKDCLSLRDLEEMQKINLGYFCDRFNDTSVFGWKSIMSDAEGKESVPFLYGYKQKVSLEWVFLSDISNVSVHPLFLHE